jgi:Saccharopine dehydrogenase NADP binding domain
MTTKLKILIVGGYGIFGGRLVERLENEPRLTLLVGGRSAAKADHFVKSRNDAKARLIPVAFDRDGDLATQLSSIAPDLVVDASGPFQNYGERPYRVVEACVSRGINYLDLADGTDFVAGIAAFDKQAQDACVFVLSGVSSFPVLTAAAVRRLSVGMTAVNAICGGIAPSPYAVVGENVIRAIASYAGQPIQRMCNGKLGVGYPFTEQLRYTIAPPDYLPLAPRMFSLVDVPDLRALAPLWPQAKEIWMGAAPVQELLHRGLIALAWLVRLRLIPSLLPLAPLFHFATNHVRWGKHRGGMFVDVEGVDASGRPMKRSWHLLAEGDDGPYIPSMAVEAIVRNVLAGHVPRPGARAAVHDLELDDYAKVFAGRAILTGIRESGVAAGVAQTD